MLGAGIHYIKSSIEYQEVKKFDYSSIDSIFFNADTDSEHENSDSKITDKKVDYEPELLDFSKNKKIPEIDSSVLNFVNVNTAGIADLMSLPGIGEKTAQNIIALRNKKNGFKKIEELLEVKGIGKSKLQRLKKFLIIE